MLAFSCLKTEFTDHKLIEFKFWCNVQRLNGITIAQAQTQETSYAQAQKQETSIQTELQRKYLRLNTWYTISGVHKYKLDKTFKTLEFLRYESC